MQQDYIQNENLAFDLRMRYAKIVGDHLEDVAIARKDKDYPNYFDALDDLYTITKHKFKRPKAGKKEKSYSDLVAEAIRTFNLCPLAYTGESKDPKEVSRVEVDLKKIEKFLYKKMDEANLFGSKRNTEGLV